MQQTTARSAGIDLSPDLSMLGLFWGAVLDIRRTLAGPEPVTLAGARDRLAVIRQILDAQLPGPAGGMPSLLPGPGDGDPVPAIMARLAAGELFTAIAADYAGETISARVVRYPDTALNQAEAGWLQADGGTRVLRRRGELRTAVTGRLAARVTSALIPGRVRDQDALAELAGTDIPLGTVIARLGGHRTSLWAWPYCGTDTIVHACGLLWLPGRDGRLVPAGLATEQVTPLDWWAAAS